MQHAQNCNSVVTLAIAALTVLACSGSRPQPQVPVDLGVSDLGASSDLAMPGGSSCSSGSVCWENPLPQGNDLLAAWASSDSDAWAVGIAGVAVHWDGQMLRPVSTASRAN